ncbi:HAMP domain-containing sensor histidine kinase [Caulobacter sp. NIBR1757]|uniref:sensor histidine kinase n=1 Tax=Caulobacter sp. NIBR1757 TaxID=3016000 RepID=UPI0022F132FE|nr:HAMP domain-containing sensor histidine kinase [Caulobacter sp. NIBR1757]WGM39897.1 Adaptive-response sensory-kinase SasA [Caulobacter sp. NIBR1757]
MTGRGRLGLGSRLALLTAGGFFALQLIGVIGVLLWNAQDTGRWRLPFPDRLAAMAETLEAAAPATDRQRLLRAFSSNEVRVRLIDRSPPDGWMRPAITLGAAPPTLYGSALQERRVEVIVRQGSRRLFRRENGGWGREAAVVVHLRGGGLMMVDAGTNLRRQLMFYVLLAANIVFGLAIMALIWRSARAMAAPLQAIADRADRFSLDLDAEPMPEAGPPEALSVAAAFNRLRGRVRGLMAERLSMLAAIAHDLKTYLTRLRIRAAMIADPVQRDLADRDIRQMSALIEDVLQVARGEERPTATAPVDIASLLEEVVEGRRAAGDAVTAGLFAGPVIVEGDEAGLRRVIENLIDNAVKYAGAAEITLSAAEATWTLDVVDHGPGLPEHFADEAFEPFTRAETSRSRQTGGAGLGLAIARGLARASGGEVVLAPTPGGGLTARLILPR